MRKRVDLLPVTQHELKVSALHRVWIKVGFGIQLRARTTASGYDIRIRYGKDDLIKKSHIKVEYGAKWANGNYRPTLSCSTCGKLAFQNLYLDPSLEDLRFRCAKCHGVKPWQVRTPIKWDIAEETKFRHLLRRKVDEDILKFELAALKTLTIEEFFKTRPYLVPEFVDKIKALNPVLHRKMLKVLHGKYKAVMARRRIQLLNEKETKWLMEKLDIVFDEANVITKKEVMWRKNREPMLKSLSGSQPGSRLDQSSSPPSVTDCSSKKIASGVDMSVEPVEEVALENAPSAPEQVTTLDAALNSSVLIAPTEE